ncbi:PREDICTED: protein FAM205CP-like isoform X1 [Myotis davidii]|uniref:protein FAM205CP-like isoform X1 n=2 Tax=Myotis davidii TaxID=225400 RepID=UPI000766F9D5|nr:PREDICTED: protein FAM205CP-like isoform X1 [Myotis davidii]
MASWDEMWHQRRIKQRTKDRTSRARKHSSKEDEKPWELIAIMKSQRWFPQEGSVRRLLCADPSCPVCNAMALEIKQLLASESTPVSPTSSRRSQGSSCLDILSMSDLSFDPSQSSQHSRELSVAPVTPSMTQLKDHKSLTQSASQSPGAISIQDYWADHQLRQEFPAPDVFWDARDPSSWSLEECRIPVNQQNKKSNTKYVSEKQEAAEAGLGNKMKHFTHWIKHKLKDQGHKESILLSEDETVAKTTTKKVEESTLHQTPCEAIEDKNITFFDAHQCLDNELQQHPFESGHSWFQCFSHNRSTHCPQLTCATQLKIHARSQLSPQQ